MTWDYAYTPRIWPSVLVALLLSGLSVYTWRRRTVRSATVFGTGCLLAALWVGGSALEEAAADAAAKVFWLKFQGVWQLPTTTAMTCFVLEYVWPGRWLTTRNLALLSVPPVLSAVLMLTNRWHHLMWLGFAFDGTLVPLRGAGAWASIAYSYGVSLINVLAFALLFLHSPEHRWPVAIILTGQVTMRVVYALDAFGVMQSRVPVGTLVTGVMFLIYGVALFGFGWLDPVPLARRTLINQMHDGVLVLDVHGRVASLNPAAKKMLGAISEDAVGRSIRDLLPMGEELDRGADALESGGTEFALGNRSETRYYTLDVSYLTDWRRLRVGQLLLIRDVTVQKQIQAQSVKQERVLAMLKERERLSRELHDSLGQVFAFIDIQGQTVRRLIGRGDISAADRYLGRLIDAAREANTDIRESIHGLRLTSCGEDLFETLDRYLTRFERNSGIKTKLERLPSIPKDAFEPLVEVELLRILQEALTNVRKHAKASCVEVSFCAADGWARITVTDNGEGFDLYGRSDLPGEHIGLRVMHERAAEVGGRLDIHSRPGQGSEITVQVPMRVLLEGAGVRTGDDEDGEQDPLDDYS